MNLSSISQESTGGGIVSGLGNDQINLTIAIVIPFIVVIFVIFLVGVEFVRRLESLLNF